MNSREIICRVRALYAYESNDPSSLSFQANALIDVLAQLDSGWWDGWCDGRRGWFPSNYVEVLKDNQQEEDQLWELQQQWRLNQARSIYQRPIQPSEPKSPLRLSLNASDSLIQGPKSDWLLQTTEDGSEQYYYNPHTQEMRYSIPPEGFMTEELMLIQQADITPTKSQESFERPVRPARAANRVMEDMYSQHQINTPLPYRKAYQSSEEEIITQSSSGSEKLPPNWIRKVTPKGKFYYCNIKTDETTWYLEHIDPDTGVLQQTDPLSSPTNLISNQVRHQDVSPMSWNTISTGIAQAIYQLKESIQQQPSVTTEQSTAIVHRVRGMLYACECLDKDTSVHLNNKTLRNQHRSLLATLAKLALSAKASSDTKLQSDADDVLVAVRDFVTCAQDLGIDIKDTKPTLVTTPPKVGIKNNGRDVMLGLADASRAAMASYLYSIHEALSHFVNNQDVQGTLERLKANAPLLVAQFRNVSNTTSHLLNAMDESPTKHTIYAAMGSLFILSQTITNARLHATQLTQIAQRLDHDAKALESGIHDVMESKPASLTSESIHSLLEEDDSEKTRRADIGLGTLMANPSGTLLPDDLSTVSSTSELQRPNKEAKVDKFFGVDAAGRRRDTVMSPTSSYANGSEKSWFLQSDIDAADVVFNMEGNVKGGTLHALVQRLTQHDQLDSKFNTTFLLTYRSFCTTEELFAELFSRYVMDVPEGLSKEETDVWREQKLKLVRLRMFNVMKSWLETYFNEEEDRPILPILEEFTKDVISISMSFGADQLTKLIKKRMLAEDNSQIRKMKLNVRTNDMPAPILPKNMKRIRLLEVDPLELARQMTIMDFRLYNRIKPVECLDKNWGKPDTEEVHIAANVKASIEHSNQVTAWVTDSILSKEELKKRAVVLKHWIFIAERCRLLNNYNTCMAILSAFDNGSIGRLKRTWELISTRTMQTLSNIRRLMGANRNFSEYRDIIHKVNPPCIPFLGIYLQDLTFIEDGNANFLKKSNHLVNFAKRMKTAEVIQDLQQYQSTHYMLTAVPDIQEFIKTHLHSSREEEELYNLSLKLEPRERGEDTIARRLKESGL